MSSDEQYGVTVHGEEKNGFIDRNENKMSSDEQYGVTVHGEEKNGFIDRNENKSLDKEIQDMDNLFIKLGDPGRLQLIWFSFLAFNLFTVAPNAVVGVFFGYSPAHVCNASIDSSDFPGDFDGRLIYITNHNSSSTTSEDPTGSIGLNNRATLTSASLFYSRPEAPQAKTTAGSAAGLNGSDEVLGIVQYGGCSVNLTLNASSYLGQRLRQKGGISRSCERGQWVYDLSGREATTVTDFDLVCDRRFLTALASSLYYLGLMLANASLGYASDVLGRRPVILLTLHLILVTGLWISFANSFLMFAILRVVMGLLSQGLQSASFVMAIELFPVHHRGLAGCVIQFVWGLGCLYLSAVAWFVQDWRIIQLALLVPTALNAISLWSVNESLRWLLAKGKTQRASETVERVAAFNKIPSPLAGDDHSVLAEYKVHCEKHHSSYLALVRTPQMFRRTVCLSVVLFGVNTGYFGMTYNNAELAGDRYLNFFLGSITETVAYGAGAFVVVRFGRKRTLFACLLSGALCCLISGCIPRSGGLFDSRLTWRRYK